MKSLALLALSATAVSTSAQAGFVGFVANTRSIGAYTVIDVFAAVSNANDKFLNVYNCNASSNVGDFVNNDASKQAKTAISCGSGAHFQQNVQFRAGVVQFLSSNRDFVWEWREVFSKISISRGNGDQISTKGRQEEKKKKKTNKN